MQLTRSQERQREALAAALEKAAAEASRQLALLLKALPAAVEPLNAAIRLYNAAAEEAEAFAREIAEELESRIEDKSERWQEGDAGQEATSFKDEWESFDAPTLEEVCLLDPELEYDVLKVARQLRELPSESG